MRTVKVRIAVAVNENGAWSSAGWSYARSDRDLRSCAVEGIIDAGNIVVHWIEAELPVPESQVVQGAVVDQAAE